MCPFYISNLIISFFASLDKLKSSRSYFYYFCRFLRSNTIPRTARDAKYAGLLSPVSGNFFLGCSFGVDLDSTFGSSLGLLFKSPLYSGTSKTGGSMILPSPSSPLPAITPLYSGTSKTGGSIILPSPSRPLPAITPVYSETSNTGGLIGFPFSSIPLPALAPSLGSFGAALDISLRVVCSVTFPVFGSTVYVVVSSYTSPFGSVTRFTVGFVPTLIRVVPGFVPLSVVFSVTLPVFGSTV